MKLVICLFVCLFVVSFSTKSGEEKDADFVLDIPEGLEFIEEEFVEPISEDSVDDAEEIGSIINEPVELLTDSEIAELEGELTELERNNGNKKH